MSPTDHRPLELWVGVEATVNRVRDAFMDQLELNGFASRLDDLDRVASLGATRVRFPVLWERTAPHRDAAPDWSWLDPRMQRLQELNVVPIAGLVHHGSGPAYTHLLDPDFPQHLARYARAVAARYPHVDAYTPVNEPLTTARFSGLYGHWYPHGTTDREWLQALLTELKATVLAMQAIREVRPDAQLVQTEDLGFTHCTPGLAYQAEFENERRWLTFDILCGRVDRQHALWAYLRHVGATESELMWFVEHPCPPDVLGVNAYATSERFLDHRLHLYPEHTHGGNGRDRYADVEALRVLGCGIGGMQARLVETHERYGRTIAVTEAHLGCTRDEQMRWLMDCWRAAEAARQAGADVRALTVWAAFGTFEWASLLTRREGHYEPGLWDVRAPQPRPTALTRLARDLAAHGSSDHPVLHGPGWWERELRLLYPAHGAPQGKEVQGPPLLITGATGTLGRAFARLCDVRGLPYRLVTRQDMDITDPASVRAALAAVQPWAVVNTAGYVRVDDAETDPRNWQENAEGAGVLAAACAELGIPLVTFSTDLVFDGSKREPYVESDTPRPLNAYGRSKLEAERRVLGAHPESLVVRTSAFFGPWDEYNFVTLGLRELQHGRPWRAAADQVVSPTYVPHLVHHTLDLLLDGERGLWHLANDGAVSWADFARMVAERAGLDAALVEGVPGAQIGQIASRPAYSAMRSERGWIMPALEKAVDAYFEDVRTATRTVGCATPAPARRDDAAD